MLAALDNSPNSSQLKLAFSEMSAKNVKIHVTVTDTPPSDFSSDTIAKTTFNGIQNADGTQSFANDAVVEIVVVSSRINNPNYENLSFERVFAHELMHLFRDESGKFIKHPPGQVEFPGIDGVFQDLYKGFDAKDYLDSTTVSFNYTQVPTPDMPFIPAVVEGFGTDGNNLIKIPDNPSSAWTTAHFTTGAGNDTIIGGQNIMSVEMDTVSAGVKIISSPNARFFSINIADRASLSGISFNRLGDDLIIDFSGGNNPSDLQNGMILNDFYVDDGYVGISAGSESQTLRGITVPGSFNAEGSQFHDGLDINRYEFALSGHYDQSHVDNFHLV